MTEQEIFDELLDRGWTETELRRAAELWRQLESTPASLQRWREMEEMRALLRSDRAEPAGGWDALESRLRLAIDRAATGPAPRRLVHPALWWAASGALAAALMMAVGLWWLDPGQTGDGAPVRLAAGNGAADARMTPQEMTQQVQVFKRVAEVFEGQAKWVAVSDRGSDVGLNPTPEPIAQRLLLLRLTVSRSGKLQSRSDVAIVAGQDADLTLPTDDDQQLRYRIGTTASTPVRLSLWVELQRADQSRQTLAAMATELTAKPGDLIKAGQLSTMSGQYQFGLGFFEAPMPGSDHTTGVVR